MTLVRDDEGRPFRLYPKSALPKLLPSLAILCSVWQTEARQARRQVPRKVRGLEGLQEKSQQVVKENRSAVAHSASIGDPEATRKERVAGRRPRRAGRTKKKPSGAKKYWSSHKLTHAEREGNTK